MIVLVVVIWLTGGERLSYSVEEPSMNWCLTVSVKERAAAAAALFDDIDSIDFACQKRVK